jgi:hypothetical protein
MIRGKLLCINLGCYAKTLTKWAYTSGETCWVDVNKIYTVVLQCGWLYCVKGNHTVQVRVLYSVLSYKPI